MAEKLDLSTVHWQAQQTPFLPGISGEEDKSLEFLSNLNIPLKEGDKFRALRIWTEDERRRLCSALAEYLLSKGMHYGIANLIGNIYVLTAESPGTALRDAREFAVVLNSTGRMDRPSYIAVCMGDRTSAHKKRIKFSKNTARASISTFSG